MKRLPRTGPGESTRPANFLGGHAEGTRITGAVLPCLSKERPAGTSCKALIPAGRETSVLGGVRLGAETQAARVATLRPPPLPRSACRRPVETIEGERSGAGLSLRPPNSTT